MLVRESPTIIFDQSEIATKDQRKNLMKVKIAGLVFKYYLAKKCFTYI